MNSFHANPLRRCFTTLTLLLLLTACSSATVAQSRHRSFAALWNPEDALLSSGATCSTMDRVRACVFKSALYPQPIVVLIPPSFVPQTKHGFVFLHGFVTNSAYDRKAEAIIRDFEIPQAIDASEVHDLLILPFSRGANLDYHQVFSDHGRFSAVIRDVLSRSGCPHVDAMSFSVLGHSGAYKPLGRILASDRGEGVRIRKVGLFDATYSDIDTDAYDSWIRSNPNEFEAVYLHGTPTTIGANLLRSKWNLRGEQTVPVGASRARIWADPMPASDRPHWMIVRDHLPDLLKRWTSKSP